MEWVRGSKVMPDNAKLRVSKPKGEQRYCDCGRKLSKYNPNETCWEHTAPSYPRVRGRPSA